MLFDIYRAASAGVRVARGASFRPRQYTRVAPTIALIIAGAILQLGTAHKAQAQTGNPSRAASKGCKWERASDQRAGLAAWVERCDYGDRKIHFFIKGNALFQQYSDGGTPDALIEVFDLEPNESAQAGVQRVYLAKTPKAESARCVIAAYTAGKAGAGAARYTFVPNAAYAKQLNATDTSGDIPEPPCGEWGTAPDGQQFFQAWPTGKVRKILFVRIGQDEPLYDEMTLQLLPTPAAKAR